VCCVCCVLCMIQVEGLAAADHSPSILLLDAVSERLHTLTTSSSSSGSDAASDPASSSRGGNSSAGRDAGDQAGGGNSNGGALEEHVGAIQARLRDLGHSGDVGDQGLGLGGKQGTKEQPDRAGPGGSDHA
jgi:hypothetical protein